MGNELNATKYKIIKMLGKGGFATTYLAEKENKIYALKKYSDITQEETIELKKIFEVISTLNNPNIIKYYESFNEGNSYNIIMEYGGSYNLKKFIQHYSDKSELIKEKIIYDIIIQICLGLKELHKNNIIHRNLTPNNIILDKNNKIKIAGFSVIKELNPNVNYLKDMVGTSHYMAPEISKGEKYNQKVDIYSLGCILYELLTLNEYYVDSVIDEKPITIPEVYNSKWQEIIDSLLNKDYNARPNIDECIIGIQLIQDEIK